MGKNNKPYTIEYIKEHLSNDYNYEINIERPYCE